MWVLPYGLCPLNTALPHEIIEAIADTTASVDAEYAHGGDDDDAQSLNERKPTHVYNVGVRNSFDIKSTSIARGEQTTTHAADCHAAALDKCYHAAAPATPTLTHPSTSDVSRAAGERH